MYLHRSISTTLEVLKTTSTYTSKASLRSSKINIFDISILKAKTQGLFKLKNKRLFFFAETYQATCLVHTSTFYQQYYSKFSLKKVYLSVINYVYII